ncbi:unnamed protein product [Darwinula stevensoni]|uniref:Lysosome-associated membrane glycoprotein 2-like luminal domain-containing protein n=1 Tax=Darwinula stevensoni TaxID=69355 RepID=A0A7R9FRV0_9CRUS|nr:unnamed protein product [Darwinula stevensoni]CAG0902151.1 unnamed protein product [Darwinula stevensoni]
MDGEVGWDMRTFNLRAIFGLSLSIDSLPSLRDQTHHMLRLSPCLWHGILGDEPNVPIQSPMPEVKIQLESAAKRQETTNPSVETTTTKPRTRPTQDKDGVYRVYDENNQVCILGEMNLSLNISYKSNEGKMIHTEVTMPDDPVVGGNCEDNVADLSLTWNRGLFALTISFDQNAAGTRWQMHSITLVYDRSDKAFKNSHVDGGQVTLMADQSTMPYFGGTRMPYAYYCPANLQVQLRGKNSPDEGSATLTFSFLHLKPFVGPSGDFGPPAERCETVNEAVAIAVGSILAISTGLLIVGYAIYRYIKVKKVHYNTME